MNPAACILCSRITAEALASEQGHQHACSPSQLESSGEHCSLCYTMSLKIRSRIEYSDSRIKSWLTKTPRHGPIRLRLSLDESLRTAYIKMEMEGRKGAERSLFTEVIEDYPIRTVAGDPAAQYGVPVMQISDAVRFPDTTRSPGTSEFVQLCLDDCLKHHNCSLLLGPEHGSNQANAKLDSASSYPSRLVFVGTLQEPQTRLVEVRELCPRYFTLSYRWGSPLPHEYRTLNSNFTKRLSSIPEDVLPLTIRDAILITRTLRLQYLWVDAICIIQDSTEDWASESLRMGDIYQNSTLTIAASRAVDCTDSCFSDHQPTNNAIADQGEHENNRAKQTKARSKGNHGIYSEDGGANDNEFENEEARLGGDTRPPIAAELRGYERSGKPTILRLLNTNFEREPRALAESVLNERGWVLQERVLSPRTVHFSWREVIWECREHFLFESGRTWIHGSNRFSKAPTLSAVLRHDVMRISASKHWFESILWDQYTKRDFTNKGDRLIAIAGIAKAYQRVSGDEYLAGLWQSALASGLCWEVFRNGDDPPGEISDRRRPTWSWTSHNACIWNQIDDDLFLEDDAFRLISVNLRFSFNLNSSFSPIEGGYIAVSGRMFKLWYDGTKDVNDRMRVEGIDDVWPSGIMDYLREWDDNHELFGLLLGGYEPKQSDSILQRYFLVVAKHDEGGPAYVRVGRGMLWFKCGPGSKTAAQREKEIQQAWKIETLHLY